jgi:hypothetical protein
MSGTTTTNANANATNIPKNYDDVIFTGEKSEFGMPVFSHPSIQATYEYHETEYKKKYVLKHAYDKQEFLRKMRADIKREYLTRKKQVKQLQRDAAVNFRNAEMSLQEHYASASASAQGQEPWRIHGVDICAPLVSQIQLPHGETLDLKTLHYETEFAKLRGIHEDLRQDQVESIRIQEEGQQCQREYEAANEASWNQWTQKQYYERSAYKPRSSAFGGCYDEEHYPDEQDNGNDCFSYDSEYDGIFPDYQQREYNYEREIREEEEAAAAAAAAAAEQQRWEENTRNSDGETWDEEAIADEAEHRREVAQMKLDDDDMTYTCDDHPDVQQLEHIQVTEPKERFTASTASTGGMLSAQKKAAAGAAAKAAKARQAKQQQKKEKAKFVPLQVTINANRVSVDDAESESVLLYRGKVQVNLPKKNLQNVSREDKKRHDEKWRRINAAQKHASARGTRIANIPEPRSWHNCGGSDNDNDNDNDY